MNLSLHQLQVFVTVAQRLSFSRAAEDLLLTQPAVSMQIKAVERAVGLPLFDHAGKRIQLTEAGKELYERSGQVLGLMDDMAQAMADLRKGKRGRLRVIATTTVGIYVVPNLMGRYHHRHPEVELRLEVANWERTCERLFARQADVAIAGPHPQPGLHTEPFMDDELVVIASADHPLSGSNGISLEELSRQPMLVREPGSGTRAAVEKVFADRNLPLYRAMELSRNGAIKQVVHAGLGIAVISRAAIALELDLGILRVLDVEGFPIVRSWNVITHSGFSLSPTVVTFCQELRAGLLS